MQTSYHIAEILLYISVILVFLVSLATGFTLFKTDSKKIGVTILTIGVLLVGIYFLQNIFINLENVAYLSYSSFIFGILALMDFIFTIQGIVNLRSKKLGFALIGTIILFIITGLNILKYIE